MQASADPAEEAYLEVLEASGVLGALEDAARVEAWASSVLGVWGEDPEAAAIDVDFIIWLDSCDDPRAPLVLLALSSMLHIEPELVATALSRLEVAPSWFAHLRSAQPTRAWLVREDRGASMGIGFVLADGSEHSLLADIIDGELGSLVVAPGPDELFDGSEDLVAPKSIALGDAAAQIVSGWRAVVGQPDIPESVYVNSGIARLRLAPLAGADLEDLFRPSSASRAPTPAVVGRSTEDQELDAWAISQLDMVGLGPGVSGPDFLRDAIDPTRVADYPDAERQAFESLEWADWLGMVIGLSRAGVGAHVDPTMLVDEINRCPEVTSSIPKKDRPYFEWAFTMLLPLWRRAGVIDSTDCLTADGADMLVHALRAGWAVP